MKREELLQKVDDIIEDKIGNWEPISEEDHIFNDLGFDSLDSIEFIMECEKEFNISIDDSKVDHITTIGEILDYLQEVVK